MGVFWFLGGGGEEAFANIVGDEGSADQLPIVGILVDPGVGGRPGSEGMRES